MAAVTVTAIVAVVTGGTYDNGGSVELIQDWKIEDIQV